MPTIILAILFGLPVLLLMLLRSNAAVVFLALCAGLVLNDYIGADARFAASIVAPKSTSLITQAVSISLILLPAIVGMVELRKKVSGLKLALGIIPATTTGLLVALSVVPYLSPITREQIRALTLWHNIFDVRGLILGVGVLFSIVLLRPKHLSKEDKKHHKSHH